MSRVESAFCRTTAWGAVTRRIVLPWATQNEVLRGDVLEVGAGGGAMACAVLAQSPEAQLTATDFDPVMVRDLSRRLQPFGHRAEARRADVTDLPFPAGAFDVVLSFLMLHHVVAWELAVAEAVRVLRPGGLLLGYDLLATPPWRALHWVEGAPHRLFTADQLRSVLNDLPVGSATVRVARGGQVARFLVRT